MGLVTSAPITEDLTFLCFSSAEELHQLREHYQFLNEEYQALQESNSSLTGQLAELESDRYSQEAEARVLSGPLLLESSPSYVSPRVWRPPASRLRMPPNYIRIIIK